MGINITKTDKKPFDYGLRIYKEKNYGKGISIRLDNAQEEILDKLIKDFPNLYESKAHIIRCAVNFFLRHQRKKGIEEVYRK